MSERTTQIFFFFLKLYHRLFCKDVLSGKEFFCLVLCNRWPKWKWSHLIRGATWVFTPIILLCGYDVIMNISKLWEMNQSSWLHGIHPDDDDFCILSSYTLSCSHPTKHMASGNSTGLCSPWTIFLVYLISLYLTLLATSLLADNTSPPIWHFEKNEPVSPFPMCPGVANGHTFPIYAASAAAEVKSDSRVFKWWLLSGLLPQQKQKTNKPESATTENWKDISSH